MDKEVLDLYTDCVISSFGQVTATGLSSLLGGRISHDRITRFLNAADLDSATLWKLVKPLVREIEREDAVLIIDDSILPKPYTDESELVCWHYDHSEQRSVKGINLLTTLYYSQNVSLPVAFETVTKPDIVLDKKTGKPKRQARQTKNELYRKMLSACAANNLAFRYVLNDIWYAASENMVFIKETLHKDFVMPIKSNRKVALSAEDKDKGRYVTVSKLDQDGSTHRIVWLEGVTFPLLFVRQVFRDEDGTVGILYLISSDIELTYEQITTIYQKRWKVETYHKSLKSNLALTKSPTRVKRSQNNHIFASLVAFVKLERLSIKTKLNHFALKTQLYKQALASAFEELRQLRDKCSCANNYSPA
jgi:SRSO17 transposase